MKLLDFSEIKEILLSNNIENLSSDERQELQLMILFNIYDSITNVECDVDRIRSANL